MAKKEKVDWQTVENFVVEKLGLIEKAYAEFLKEHPEWNWEIVFWWKNYPPRIFAMAKHKPVSDLRRAEHIDATGIRLAYPSDEEKEVVGVFMAKMAEEYNLRVWREHSFDPDPRKQSILHYIFKPRYGELLWNKKSEKGK